MRLHCAAALSLAVQLLSQSRARTNRRLDERDISQMGGSARRDDRVPGELVSITLFAQIDDRSAGLRRWWQPGSVLDRRKEPRQGQRTRAQGLALPAPSGGACLLNCG